ncbi:hypothetical protein EHW64_19505 [Erwinia psidii]|uniref:hypothetical protein n=1 Tax=Erwinia psidii TaxID=69224 RepID=UPI00226BBD44|nr:hypothetical protein [Erwinia psidii]MCX8958332.1 hypothetical protein [Erwinia psidii]MCX8963238.1 hypothetical protein [Erwinia psidii]
MDIDQVRYRFECHLDDFYPTLPIALSKNMPCSVGEDNAISPGVEYKDPAVQLMWKVFYAGALSQNKNMVTTLPRLKNQPDGFYDAGYNEGVQDCRRHLVARGIRISK